jgi:hypothetical protein
MADAVSRRTLNASKEPCSVLSNKFLRSHRRLAAFAVAPIMALHAVVAEPDEPKQTETRIVTLSMMASPPTIGETPPLKGQVPQAILDPILKEAAALAKLDREQLVIVRAESAVWNDGSLGCPEPGMMYTQAQVNGYWIVIEAAGQKYDFRVGRGGSFRLCPPGQGHPPSQESAK